MNCWSVRKHFPSSYLKALYFLRVLTLAWLSLVRCQDGNETLDSSPANEIIKTSTADGKADAFITETTVEPFASPEAAPSDVRLKFAPSVVTVYFKPATEGKTGEHKGCEVVSAFFFVNILMNSKSRLLP
ncbi:hypothetical protein ANCCAN_23350 [Ancylostoma caninum]|uniref:Uncharacterized protein n=1 Tax=Ancylostoma caninum TaxID=29170 RepID=A0A368FFE5_ANCCA|nr:hypothetical protein ANCCAN_23350 [Ancylostoma caninum]